MRGFAVFFTLVAVAAVLVAVGVGTYHFFRRKRDDRTPPRDSYYLSSLFKSGATWTQTQQVHKPPPPSPAHTRNSYRSPPTYAHSQTAPRTPAPPGYGGGTYQFSADSPQARKPNQSSTRAKPSSNAPSRKLNGSKRRLPTATPRTSGVPDYGRGAYHPSVVSSYTRTPSETRPSSALTQPSSAHTQQSSVLTQPFSTCTQPYPPYSSLFDNHFFAQSAPSSSRVPAEQLATPSPSPPLSPGPAPAPTPVAQPAPLEEGLSSDWEHQDRSLWGSYYVDHNTRSITLTRPASCAPAEGDPLPPTVIEVATSDLRSDGSAGVEDLDYAKKLREQARRRGLQMKEARSRAKIAQKKGRGGAAHAHRRDAIAYESAMKKLNKRAAEIIFRENNKNHKEGVIDLHGLHVTEAVKLAKDQVQTARSRGDGVVRFIVGKGLHSRGEAKIRPALVVHFTKQGLTHSLDPKNAGVLVVRLDQQ